MGLCRGISFGHLGTGGMRLLTASSRVCSSLCAVASIQWVGRKSATKGAGWLPFSPAATGRCSVIPAPLLSGASGSRQRSVIELSLPSPSRRRRSGLRIHRRPSLGGARHHLPPRHPRHYPDPDPDRPLASPRPARDRAGHQRGGQIRPRPPAGTAPGTRRASRRARRRRAPPDPRSPYLPAHQGGARTALPAARRARPDCPSRSPASGSTSSKSTSTGRTSGWSSRPMGCATTARQPSRPGTGCATRRTPPPASPSCASPTSRSATNPSTSCGS